MTIEYHVVHDPEELKVIVTLQTVIWSMASADEAVPHNMLQAVIHSGGMVIRADDDGQPVGFALALAALNGEKRTLWSHMAGVIPGFQNRGIGVGVKFAQRKWALEHGYPSIGWTFDPLQRGNANFNLHLLKATTSTYHVNFYGAMTDGINAGMPSDRLEVDWDLLAGPVIAAEAGTPAPAVEHFPREAFLLDSDDEDAPRVHLPQTWTSDWHFAEIPYQITALKRANIERAKAWQLALREAMISAFAHGYTAVDFADDGQRCWYVLSKAT